MSWGERLAFPVFSVGLAFLTPDPWSLLAGVIAAFVMVGFWVFMWFGAKWAGL